MTDATAIPTAHEAAAIYPLMSGTELQELADDIKEHGLIHPIVLLDDKILDGRNRLAACQMADVQPRYVAFPGGMEPIEYVIAANEHRRHLTVSQRAAAAALALPFFKTKAIERKREAGRTYGRGHPKSSGSEVHNLKAQSEAGEAFGVSGGSVARAHRVLQANPELFEEVRKGETTVTEAAIQVGEPHNPGQRRPTDPDAHGRIAKNPDRTRAGIEERRKKVLEMAEQSYTVNQIAEATGYSTETVSGLIRDAGLIPLNRSSGFSQGRIDVTAAMEQIVSTVTIHEVALDAIYADWSRLDRSLFARWDEELTAALRDIRGLRDTIRREISNDDSNTDAERDESDA